MGATSKFFGVIIIFASIYGSYNIALSSQGQYLPVLGELELPILVLFNLVWYIVGFWLLMRR